MLTITRYLHCVANRYFYVTMATIECYIFITDIDQYVHNTKDPLTYNQHANSTM